MQDSNTGVLLALIGVGIAAVMIVSGGGSSGSSGGTSRREVVRGFQSNDTALQALQQQLNQIATGSSGSSSSGSSSSSSSGSSGSSGGFAQMVVERTGFLPSGFDAAGRVSINNRTDQGDGSAGFVGL
jgi:hypothetical protein